MMTVFTSRTFSLIAGMSAVAMVTAFGANARADAIADFYKDRHLNLIISSSPGGGYDTYSRTVARHLPNHLPGKPSVVAQNMPGAGGLRAGNHLFNVADKDGSVIGAVQNNVPFIPLTRPDAAKFDALKFNWLGSPNSEVGLLLVWHETPVHTMADLKEHEVILATSGAASTPAFYGRLIRDVFDVKIRLIAGYQGQTEAFLAMERGEHHGYPSTFWSSLKVVRPEWIKENKVRLLMQYALKPHPELPDVPFGPELLDNAEDRELFELAVAPLAVGRPFLAPPDVPSDRIAALRNALVATFRDEGYIADATKQRLEIGNYSTGEELDAVIRKAYRASEGTIKRLNEIDAQGRQ